MNLHRLDGCAPTPLAHYLKALGILRIVSEQLDPEARGWWEGDRFVLASQKTEQELLDFFLESYEPTPMFNPWGARSGFYAGSSEKTSRQVLERIAASSAARFDRFRQAIDVTRRTIIDVTGGAKPGDTDKDGKLNLVRELRAKLRGAPSSWLEAVIAIVDSGDKGMYQPAILGTGGSEGSGSYTAAFMKAVSVCLLDRSWEHALRCSLFASDAALGAIWEESFGQFVPSGVASPWDLLLAFEGACGVRSSVAKRSEESATRWSASPFFVAPVSTGFSSASRIDEFALNKGKELPGRGEQWFPFWSAPATSREVSNLFAQGRALATRKQGPGTTDGHSMSRAVARLGIAKGITAFVRYGYLQRNNQATHFAVPLGRFLVPDKVSPRLACIDDLEAWLPRLRRKARDKGAPARLTHAERRLSDAVFAAAQHPDEPLRWQTVLLRLADIEALQITGSGYTAGPIPRLRPEWVSASDDGAAEFRLAVALALQAGGFDRNWVPFWGSGVRRHWVTLKHGRYATGGTGAQQRLQPGTDRVILGRNGVDDAIALVSRRLVEASPLLAARRAAAAPGDLAAAIAGEVDFDRTLALGRALMALRADDWAKAPCPPSPASRGDFPDDAWVVIRLATYPSALPNGMKVGLDPAIVRRLEAGDAATAIAQALRRLRAAGISAPVRMGSVPPRISRLWAAALAFPISHKTAAAFLARLDPRSLKETAA